MAQSGRRACKERFGLDPDHPVIALGYNASPSQRHLDMLRAIGALPEATIRDWTIVLQITYGSDDPHYLPAVREAVRALPCRALLLTDAMSEEECAYLRVATDVYVHAIPTDFLSATLREYLYAGARVLCGSWLPYPEFQSLGIEMIPFTDFGQIAPLLAEAVKTPISDDQQNKRLGLKAMFSWNAVAKDWFSLYSR